jgi:hypothetical protein
MSTMQAILLGMMLSWTPSVALLAWLLCREGVALDREQVADQGDLTESITNTPVAASERPHVATS